MRRDSSAYLRSFRYASALGSSMNLLRRILVATDFSPAGHAAVARAGQLADQYHCQLMVFHATPDWTLFSQRATAHQQHYPTSRVTPKS